MDMTPWLALRPLWLTPTRTLSHTHMHTRTHTHPDRVQRARKEAGLQVDDQCDVFYSSADEAATARLHGVCQVLRRALGCLRSIGRVASTHPDPILL